MTYLEEAVVILLRDPKVAFLTPEAELAGDSRFLITDLNDALLDFAGFGFPKNSEFTQMFNYHLQLMDEQGKSFFKQ